MSDLESIQPGEEGEEKESPSLENEKRQELDNATQEPGARIERTQSIEEAEAIESAFTELMSATTDEAEPSEVPSGPDLETTEDERIDKISEQTTEETPPLPPEIPESETYTLPHTAVGKGPIPTFPPELEDSQTEAAPESSLEPSEAVVDVIAKVLSESEFREKFFSAPEEALAEYELTSDEQVALGSLEEESINNFITEFEKRDVGWAPPYVPVRPSDEEQVNISQLIKAELTDKDINRLLGGK
jgi:hypothetical protein